MKYDVDITRNSYASLTFTVEAANKKEAKKKALQEAYDTGWDEDSYEYEVGDCSESEEEDE